MYYYSFLANTLFEKLAEPLVSLLNKNFYFEPLRFQPEQVSIKKTQEL